jgi:hypothetical protein
VIIATAGTACRAPTEENTTRPFLTKIGAATAAKRLQQKAVPVAQALLFTLRTEGPVRLT